MAGGENPTQRVVANFGVPLPDTPEDLSDVLQSLAIRRSYVIAMTGRTGSTWLAGALCQISGAGNPEEFFSDEGLAYYGKSCRSGSLREFFGDLVQQCAKDGVFGFKIDPLRLQWLSSIIDPVKTFGGSHGIWIDMKRWDIVKQAYSFARAKHSGIWHAFDDKRKTEYLSSQHGFSAISDRDIWDDILAILVGEARIEGFYQKNNIHPLRIMYEELYESKGSLLRRVLHKIDDGRDWGDLNKLTEKTQKLASTTEASAEDAFYQRNIRLLSTVFDMRSAVTLEQVEALRSQLAKVATA